LQSNVKKAVNSLYNPISTPSKKTRADMIDSISGVVPASKVGELGVNNLNTLWVINIAMNRCSTLWHSAP
jgi:hypothetical protein